MTGGESYFALSSLYKSLSALVFFSHLLLYRPDMLLSRVLPRFVLLGLLPASSVAQNANTTSVAPNHTTVLILGGGMTGIIAARTLHEQGIDDFIILDAKSELGGRMSPRTFGVAGRQVVLEMGPNWVQGTQQGNGPANPIWELVLKHNLTTAYNDMYGSVSTYIILTSRDTYSVLMALATYDESGYNNYTDVLNNAIDNFDQATVLAGITNFLLRLEHRLIVTD
jgi:polyamine oxidase